MMPNTCAVHDKFQLPRSLIRRPADTEYMPANRCAMIIDGERVLVDINVREVVPGARSVVITRSGEMQIMVCERFDLEYAPHGSRTAFGPWRQGARPRSRMRPTVVVVGTVIESETNGRSINDDNVIDLRPI